MVHLDYRDARPIYTQIVDGFRDQIRSGVLQAGDKLPSVRELATTLTINPNTIQRAYRELESTGWIATVPGKGCFACGTPAAEALQQQDMLLRFDQLTKSLLEAGISQEALIKRLTEGGK